MRDVPAYHKYLDRVAAENGIKHKALRSMSVMIAVRSAARQQPAKTGIYDTVKLL